MQAGHLCSRGCHSAGIQQQMAVEDIPQHQPEAAFQALPELLLPSSKGTGEASNLSAGMQPALWTRLRAIYLRTCGASKRTILKLGGHGRIHSNEGSTGARVNTRRSFSLASRGLNLCILLHVNNALEAESRSRARVSTHPCMHMPALAATLAIAIIVLQYKMWSA